MNSKDNKKKLTPEERAKLLAEAMAAAKDRDVFPRLTAAAREHVKNLKLAPGVKW